MHDKNTIATHKVLVIQCLREVRQTLGKMAYEGINPVE